MGKLGESRKDTEEKNKQEILKGKQKYLSLLHEDSTCWSERALLTVSSRLALSWGGTAQISVWQDGRSLAAPLN